jgi:hypothetical protein
MPKKIEQIVPYIIESKVFLMSRLKRRHRVIDR